MKNLLLFSILFALFSLRAATGQQVFKLSVNQPPQLTILLPEAIEVNEGEVVNLDSLLYVEGDISYFQEWSFYDGIETHAINSLLLTLATDGVLNLTIVDENECTDIYSVVVSIITDIEDIPFDSYNSQNIQVYPNPNDGTFEIHISDCLPEYSIQVINSLGVHLINRNLECNYTDYLGTIIIPNKEPGIYFLLLKNEDKTLYKHKVIVYK